MTKRQWKAKRQKRWRLKLAKWLKRTAKRKRRQVYSRELKPGTGPVFGNTGDPRGDGNLEDGLDFRDPEMMEKAFNATYFDFPEKPKK